MNPSVAQQRLSEGWRVHQAGDVTSAEVVYRSVIDAVPKNVNAWIYLGIALFDQRRFEESVDAYRMVLRPSTRNPIGWNNLGNSLRMLGRIEEADEAFSRSIDQDPEYLSPLKNRGTLWVWSGEIARGLQWYQEGLQIEPNEAELHRNIGVIEMLRGNFDLGLKEYRWRWKMPGLQRPKSSATLWRGEELRGKSFLLYPEQGLGDAVHFVRVAKTLADRGAKVYLHDEQRRVDLFSSVTQSLGVDRLVIDGSRVPTADYQASMIEVLDLLYFRTGELGFADELFESRSGYIDVSSDLIDYWRKWLTHSIGDGLRVGVNWQGNPDHQADVYRSVALRTLRPLFEMDRGKIEWISLQFGHGQEQIEAGDPLTILPSHVDEGSAMTDTAAILRSLDAVVTTDTSLAHLAGAMNVPCHLMLGKVPDWRWGLDGSSTSWYPSMQLHRQKHFGDWGSVVESVVDSLKRDTIA
ncbi:MAG: tetratricopeptide repeat-containing glycosyltransferase family protein [Planctomycetota bacterium]